MTRFRSFAAAVALLAAGMPSSAAQRAAAPTMLGASPSTTLGAGEVSVTPIARDGQVQVSFDLSDGFTPDVRDAVRSGLPATFSYTVELKRDAPAWFDTTLAAVTVSATVRFDNLTRRYEMSRTLNSAVEEGSPTEDETTVQRWMTHFERVPVSATSALEANGEYYVRVRMQTRPRNAWFFWPWDGSSALGHAKFTFIP